MVSSSISQALFIALLSSGIMGSHLGHQHRPRYKARANSKLSSRQKRSTSISWTASWKRPVLPGFLVNVSPWLAELFTHAGWPQWWPGSNWIALQRERRGNRSRFWRSGRFTYVPAARLNLLIILLVFNIVYKYKKSPAIFQKKISNKVEWFKCKWFGYVALPYLCNDALLWIF